jgi:hypothetical protein
MAEGMERARLAEEEAAMAQRVARERSEWRYRHLATARKLLALYGLYLCALVYVVLALQRPTILGERGGHRLADDDDPHADCVHTHTHTHTHPSPPQPQASCSCSS